MSDLASPKANLASHATAFSWLWVDPDRPLNFTEVRIEGRRQIEREDLMEREPSAWAITHSLGYELNRDGEWENTRMPSSRDDAYYQRTRWESPEAALAFIEATLPGWASEGEMPCWAPMFDARATYFQRQRDRDAAVRAQRLTEQEASSPDPLS